MTLQVFRNGQRVLIQGSQLQDFTISASIEDLRRFWGQLGEAIQQAEAEAVHEPQQGGF